MPPLPALLQGKLEDEVTQRWLKESCPGSVFQAMTRRRKVAEFRVVTPLPYASLHVASRNAGASVRGAGEPTVAEKGNREDWLLSRQTSGTESSNPVRSANESLSLSTLSSRRRNSARLRRHLQIWRHRRRPPFAGSRARRGQSLCWQVRRFHPHPTHDRIDLPACSRMVRKRSNLRGTMRFPRLVLARSKEEGDRSVRPRPRR
jgi:hypothetical protein